MGKAEKAWAIIPFVAAIAVGGALYVLYPTSFFPSESGYNAPSEFTQTEQTTTAGANTTTNQNTTNPSSTQMNQQPSGNPGY
jgi:hypothetical protein